MLMSTSGHGFVSNAEKTEIVAYCANKNANQQMSAIFNPVSACATCSFYEEPGQRVVHNDGRNNRDRVWDEVMRGLDIGHGPGVVVQPRLAKQRIPSEPDKEMDDDKNPDGEVMNFVVHSREFEVSGGCKFRGKRILVVTA